MDDVKKIQLCGKCSRETNALWSNQTKTIKRRIREKIEHYTRQHGIDKYADAKRTAYEEILHLLTEETIIFDGNYSRSGYQGDLSKLELLTRKIIHEDFRINCQEQVRITVQGKRFVVDGYITLKGKVVVLEYDSEYYHSTEQQKQRDEYKDHILTNRGYTVVRISEDIIKYEKSKFRSHILDAMYGRRQRKNKASTIQVPLFETSTE